MPIHPFLPIALLNSAERVFQLGNRSSVLSFGKRLAEERTHLAVQRLGLGRQMERREFELGWTLLSSRRLEASLCRLMLGDATMEFRGSNAPPTAPLAAAHGGIRRRRA